jgi:hypothetical protein
MSQDDRHATKLRHREIKNFRRNVFGKNMVER